MRSAITAYVTEKLADDIRAKRPIAASLCDEIYGAAYHDGLRALLAHRDFDNLKTLCESKQGPVQTLGISMLRELVKHDDVYSYLQQLWSADHLTFPARIAVQHRLLDRTDLSDERHAELLQFVKDHCDEWLGLCAEYAGGRAQVLDWCEARLDDERFPETKRWTYLCIAAASDDPERARALLRRYSAGQSFSALAARWALARIDLIDQSS